jgi:phage baseplate assembly protein W
MFDLAHQFGSDLSVGPTGDVATVSGSTLGQQRVLRRLLTNAGDYIWQLGYGAGLAQFVGQPADAMRIRAVIRSQIFKETAVARTPEPTIDVASDGAGTVSVQVSYADAETKQTQLLGFTLSDGA